MHEHDDTGDKLEHAHFWPRMGLMKPGPKLLWDTPIEEKWIVKTHAVLDQVVAEAAKQRGA